MRLALVALAAGCLATAVHADGVAPDGAGGIYVAHSVTLGQQVGLAVEHFRGDGSRAPGYETPRFIAHSSTYAPSYVAADDRGGAYALVFTGGDVVATRFDDALAPASGWPASGLLADSRALGSYGVLVPDGQGGMFGAWEKIPAKVSVRRFLSTGVFAPGWADTTIAAAPTEQFQVGPAMVADGTGDVLVAWSDYVNPGLWGQRIAADGTRLWSDNGRPIVIDPAARQWLEALASDGSGGYLLVWARAPLANECIRSTGVLRVTADGAPAPGWPAQGLVLDGVVPSQALLSDGAGGAWFLGSSAVSCTGAVPGQGPVLCHVRGDGTLTPGLPPSGLRLGMGGAFAWGLVPDHSPDATGAEGVFAFWNDFSEVRGARFSADGSLVAGWPSTGALIVKDAFPAGAVSDGSGGALAAWIANGDGSVSVSHLARDGGVTPSWPDVSRPTAFAAQPNPTRGAVTIPFALPRPGAVRITVYDMQGRSIRKVFDAPRLAAGPHTITWDGLDEHGSLAPLGVYFVDVRMLGTSNGVRVAIVR